MEALLFILILMAILFIYFLPWVIANGRDHPNANAIGILNLFLGFTVIGWIIALTWSATAIQKVDKK